jgi:hypothetical protein
MCEDCKRRQIAAAQALSVALSLLGPNTGEDSAGVLGEKVALAVADGYGIMEWEGNSAEPVSHQKAQDDASAVARAAYDQFDSNVISELEFMCGFLHDALEVIQNATRLNLMNRYKAGDRGMADYHLKMLSKLDAATGGEGFGPLMEFIEQIAGGAEVEIITLGSRVPRDTKGNPIMKPSEHVS